MSISQLYTYLSIVSSVLYSFLNIFIDCLNGFDYDYINRRCLYGFR
nr:MAG TPA_asm: hypothetical protein [Caudoviricetes sp.]DAM76098.1 MAG TPA: hypothetical protein [Caudoviricetes sp.]